MEILLIGDVAKRLGVSTATVNRYLAQRRLGTGAFPLPISPAGCKGRWLARDVENYLESLSAPNTALPSPKRQEKEFRSRQEAAREVLRRHGINR